MLFQNLCQIAKSGKYETFYVSELLIWLERYVTGNSLVVRRVSPGEILVTKVCYSENNYTFPHHDQIKPGFPKLTITRDIVFGFVSCEEKGCCRAV